MPRTTVDGMDASNLSQDELAAKIDRIVETWSSHVTGNGLDLTLAEGDVGLTADGTLRATAARAEVDPKRWPLELLSPKQIKTGTGVSLDDTRLHATMQAAIDTVNATAAQPTDAYITYDEGMGAFVIRDATIGGVIDATSAIDAVKTSALCLKQSLELGEAQLVKPQLTSDSPELIAARDAANRVLSLEIPLTKGGQELTRVFKDQIARWVSVDEDMQLDVDLPSNTHFISIKVFIILIFRKCNRIMIRIVTLNNQPSDDRFRKPRADIQMFGLLPARRARHLPLLPARPACRRRPLPQHLPVQLLPRHV